MAIRAKGEYPTIMMDSVDKFHGNQLVYIGWDKHKLINSAMAFPLPPQMPFGALVAEVMPACYKDHPEFEKVNFQDGSVIWRLNNEEFTPDFEKSLIENGGVDHKSLIRFETPHLKGLNGVGI